MSLLVDALRSKLRARGPFGFVSDAVEAIAWGACFGALVGAALATTAVLGPLALFVEGRERRCDGGCGSRSFEDCRHDRRPQ